MKRVIFAFVALWTTGSAFAGINVVQASSQITGLQLQVVDLTPDDGMTASAVPYLPYSPDFGPTTKTNFYLDNFKSDGIYEQQYYNGTVFDPFDINSVSAAGSIVKNSSGIYLNTGIDNATASNLIDTFELKSIDPQYQTAGVGIYPSDWLALTVGAHTAVNISADVVQSIEMDLSQLTGSEQWQPFLKAGYSLSVMASTSFDITNSDFEGFDESHYSVVSQYQSSESFIDEFGQITQADPVNQTKKLELTFSNDSDVDVVRYFSISAGIGYTFEAVAPIAPVEVPAVPEPGTYALMAIGLIGIGAVVRRSRLATEGGTT